YNVVSAITRALTVISLCQMLRSITFLSTILPGPADHCQDIDNEHYSPPTQYEVFYRFDASYGCGDLIFSSHFIFTLTCALLVTHYINIKLITGIAWTLAATLFILVIASHKHYSVDLVVASYTVPLVWHFWLNYNKDAPVVWYADAAERRQGYAGVSVESFGGADKKYEEGGAVSRGNGLRRPTLADGPSPTRGSGRVGGHELDLTMEWDEETGIGEDVGRGGSVGPASDSNPQGNSPVVYDETARM
ncbi:hypothetical protein TeGR_g6169, partial [Tetraparma gracilis]